MHSTGAGLACMCSSQVCMACGKGRVPPPMPSSASTAMSNCAGAALANCTPAARARISDDLASGGWCVSSPSQVTTGLRPQCCRCMAASSPSPPLLPGPQTSHTLRACGAIAQASCATARPARCIKVCGGRVGAAVCSMCWVVAMLCNGPHCLKATGCSGWGEASDNSGGNMIGVACVTTVRLKA